LDLRIAITGHRRLSDTEAMTVAVEDAIDLILRTLPAAEQANCRLIAVSALADGADRIVAHRILARYESRLEVILPLPKLEYLNDFDHKSRADFELLMARASSITTVPRQSTRENAYYISGQAVVDRANVTIAIWDGRETSLVGGTAQVVKYIRQASHPLVWINPDGPRIVTEHIRQLAGGHYELRVGRDRSSSRRLRRSSFPVGVRGSSARNS
jgi:hypothetical protein